LNSDHLAIELSVLWEMSMRRFFVLPVAMVGLFAASDASAACFGSGAFQNCTDNSGNSYTVQRFGNQTIMNGSNGNTGSMWSQHSTTMGNTTIHNGMTNGDSWHMTDQRVGNMRILNGTDSRGNSFSRTCTQVGCF
jgi:hypothetical protein